MPIPQRPLLKLIMKDNHGSTGAKMATNSFANVFIEKGYNIKADS
jgi:hypothetical protein